ncbi:MAG TPA: AsmA-like C-terminal region-containing protein, partial [Azospirillum sp.]
PGFALPDGVTGRFELAVDAITYNGGLIRQGRMEAALDNGRLNVDRVSALLPGGSDVVATGALGAANGQPTLDVRLEANADDLRSLLDWLKIDVRAVPADRLRKASLRAQVQGRPERVEVTGIDLRVDTARATGGVAYVDRGRPAYGVRLDVDNLNLDAYLPPAGDAGTPAPGKADGGKDGPVPPAVARLLREVDGTVELAVGSLLWRGVPVQGLRVDASAANGALTLREVKVADLGGVAGRLSGQVGGLAPLRNAHLALSAEAASLAGLTRVAPWPAGAPAPEKIGAVKAQGRVAGDLDKLAVELSVNAVGGTLEAGGTLANLQGTVATDLKVRATHPELAQLATLFGASEAGNVGALDLYSEVSVTPRVVSLAGIQGTVAGTPVRGKARVDLGGPRPRVQADVQTGDLDADRLLAGPAAAGKGGAGGTSSGGVPGGGDSLDLGWMRAFDGRLMLTSAALVAQGTRIDNPAMRVILADGVLTLEQFDGGVLGGQIGATGRLAAPAGRVPEAELNLTVVKAKLAQAFSGGSLDVASGTLDLDAELRTAGAGKTAMLQALSGTARLAGRDGAVRGFDMGALAERLGRLDRPQDALEAVLRGLQGGETRFSRLDGTFAIARGVATTQDLRLISEAGEATAQGQVDLPARTMDLRVRIQAKGELPPVAMRMTGPIDKPTRAFEMQEVQEYIARRAAAGLLKQAIPDLPIPVPGTSGGTRPAAPQDVIRGLIEGLRPR